MLYFKILCFFWAFIGIGSRVLMHIFKEKWATWEQNKAYKEKRPLWVILMSIIGFALVVATWIIYFIHDVQYGWILSSLISLTVIKISTLVFNYARFREFMTMMLASKKRMLQLNIAVIILSLALIMMGIYLY